jgi:hypothetical protein
VISPTDPAARYTASANSVAGYAYSDNYLIDLKHAVIVFRSSSMNTSTARLERAPRIKLDGQPSLERSWRAALAPRPSGRAKRQSAKLSPLRTLASLDVAAV